MVTDAGAVGLVAPVMVAVADAPATARPAGVADTGVPVTGGVAGAAAAGVPVAGACAVGRATRDGDADATARASPVRAEVLGAEVEGAAGVHGWLTGRQGLVGVGRSLADRVEPNRDDFPGAVQAAEVTEVVRDGNDRALAADDYCFEKSFHLQRTEWTDGVERIDCWKASHVAIEAKGSGGKGLSEIHLRKAFKQLSDYVAAGPGTVPPYLMVVDVPRELIVWEGWRRGFGGFAAGKPSRWNRGLETDRH